MMKSLTFLLLFLLSMAAKSQELIFRVSDVQGKSELFNPSKNSLIDIKTLVINSDYNWGILYLQNDSINFFIKKNSSNGNLGPLMLKDENNLLTIPSKNEQTGEENYIQINGNSSKEQFCIVLSKSELNLQDICQKIDLEEGDFSTRVNKIFSAPNVAQLNEANLYYSNGKINFEIADEQRWLIPLIFEIKR